MHTIELQQNFRRATVSLANRTCWGEGVFYAQHQRVLYLWYQDRFLASRGHLTHAPASKQNTLITPSHLFCWKSRWLPQITHPFGQEFLHSVLSPAEETTCSLPLPAKHILCELSNEEAHVRIFQEN